MNKLENCRKLYNELLTELKKYDFYDDDNWIAYEVKLLGKAIENNTINAELNDHYNNEIEACRRGGSLFELRVLCKLQNICYSYIDK